MSVSIPEKAKVSHFLVFYLISALQIGIGVLGFQRIIAKSAGYDGWISVIFAGLTIHIIIWIIYKIVEIPNGDLISAHIFLLGEKLGKFISFFFLLYFILGPTAVLRTFIEVVQVWVFPEFSTFWFSVAFLGLTIYIIYGGFRTVAGIAFFGTVLPAYLILTFAYTIPYAEINNLFPIFDHKLTDLLIASRDMSLTYLGYEALLLYYPYLKNPEKSKKWAHLAILSTTFLYTAVTIVTFIYFSDKQLEKIVWATLTMWKITEMPFVERFEYLGIANWTIVILPNVCIAIWCASRILKRTINLKQSKGVILIAIICSITINLFETREQINILNDMTGKIGFYMNYVYLPILLTALLIVKKVKKK